MKICGFTIVRNGVKFDYPFVESLMSLLPIVDRLVVNYGKSEDNTLEVLRSIADPRLEIVEREWDMSMREGGRLLSFETNKALERCRGDWGFYLQADEVLHPEEYELILTDLQRAEKMGLEAVSFRYIHFEATYDLYNPFRYRREIRAVKLGRGIISWGDAATFRKEDGSRPRTLRSRAHIYHYGWVKSPEVMLEKRREFEKLYHDDSYVEKKYREKLRYEFPNLPVLRRFKGTHPPVMEERIRKSNWKIEMPGLRLPIFLHPRTYYILLHKWGILKGDWS